MRAMRMIAVGLVLWAGSASAGLAQAPAEDLEALWRESCLWEVGSNAEKVPAARKRLVEIGASVLDFVVPAKLDTADGLVMRAIQTVLGGLAEKDKAAVAAKLHACLTAAQGNVRRNAAEVLGQVGARDAAPAISKLLTDKDARMGALRALGALKAEETAAEVVALARSDVPERLQVEATATLGAMGGPVAMDALVAALTGSRASVRFAAQFALEGRKAIAELRVCLRSEQRQVRLHGIAALGHIADASVKPDLVPLLEDPDPMVRGFAVEAITSMVTEADHDRLRALRRAEANPFVQGKLDLAIERADRAPAEAGK